MICCLKIIWNNLEKDARKIKGETNMSLVYKGNDSFMMRLSRFNISWEAFEMIRIIGTRKFRTLAEKGDLHTEVWNQWVYWVDSAPETVQEYINSSAQMIELMVDDEFSAEEYFTEKEKDRLKHDIVVREMTLSELIDLTYKEPEWQKKAPKMVKGIVETLLHYYPRAYAPDEIKEILDDFLNEAVEFAGYAGLFDE